jgi:hypothetical protein
VHYAGVKGPVAAISHRLCGSAVALLYGTKYLKKQVKAHNIVGSGEP